MTDLFDSYPYADRFPVNRALPEQRPPARRDPRRAARDGRRGGPRLGDGRCSGTMYCGDHEHYDFLNEAFGLFAHVNALQRDMCPSATRFEGEIIAMALDLMHAGAVTDGNPAGMVTGGGTAASFTRSCLPRARTRAARRHATEPRQARDRASRVRQGVPPVRRSSCGTAPVDPRPTTVAVAAVAELIDDNTIALVGSACNYGYGTIDPIAELAELALEPRRRAARRRLPRRVHPPVR